jgi:23S rRNA pseudouridine2605 synthase
VRLQKFLAQAGLASRRRSEDLIAAGSVKVNGVVVKTLGSSINPGKDRVEVEGRRVLVEQPVYRLLLKPRACLATLSARAQRPTLARYVRDAESSWQVAAPLDFPAEGVVLITSDGALADALTKSGRVPMTYHIKLQGLVGDKVIERLQRGWRWEGRPVRPVSVEALAVTEKNTWLELVVPEVRPRALKAVGDLVRHSVLKVSRVRLGGLSFEGLKMGDWRDLTKGEINDLRKRAGLAPPGS